MSASTSSNSIWRIRHGGTFLVPTVLAVVDRLRRPLEALRIDVPRFRAILEKRLVLDHRGTVGGVEGWMGTALLLAMLGAWLSGLGVGLLSLAKLAPGLWAALVGLHTLAMTSIVIVTLYAPMIVDATDVAVASSRPVPDRTLFAARVAHVAVYAVALAACCAFWPLALGWLGYRTPWLLLVVPIVVACAAACAVGLVALTFALTLRIAGPAGFQRAAFLAQLVGGVVVFAGFQLLMPLATRPDVRAWIEGTSWTRALAPPLAQGALFDLVLGDTRPGTIALCVVALLTPLALGALALRLASRHFVAALAGDIVRTVARATWPADLVTRLGRRVTSSHLERSGFDFVGVLARRDKIFLRSSVPMLVGFGAMSIAAVVPSARHDALPGFVPSLPTYMLLVGLPGLLETVRFTEHPGASWVLRTAPVASWRAFVQGGTKALFLVYVVPLLVVMSAVALFLGGERVVLHVFVSALVTAGASLVGARLLKHGIPFWREPKMGELDFTNLGVMIGSVGFAVLFAGVHAVAALFLGPFGVAGLGGVGLLLLVVGWRGLGRIAEPTWR